MRTIPTLPEAKRAEVIAAARAYKGVRWRHQGRNARGVDCIGLVIAALRDCGVSVGDVPRYGEAPDGTLRGALIERLGDPVLRWTPGDVALLRWHHKGEWHTHVGLLVTHNDEWTLLHSYKAEKRVLEQGLRGDWMKRVTDVFSLTGNAA